MNLFDHADRYPNVPGFTNQSTSRQAAEEIAPSAKTLRAIVLRLVKDVGPYGLTTNELSDHMRVDRGSVQPRTSELKADGLIADSGQRRRNDNGKSAIVWVAVKEQSQ